MTYAKCAEALKPDDIREMIKVAARPGLITFAVGNPAPETFPIPELTEASRRVLEEEGVQALMYHDAQGFLPLRQKMAERIGKTGGIKAEAADILITNGAQQGMDLAGRLFVEPGDVVLMEKPTYSGGINALRTCLPRFVPVATDNDGILLDDLEAAYQKHGERIKLIYVIPDFHNPSGRTWSAARRKGFMEIVTRHGTPVVEDAAYTELRFGEDRMPALRSFDTENLVIYLGSFAKTIAPGLRSAYICAGRDLIQKFVYASEGIYFQASTYVQMLIDKYLELFDYDRQVDRIRSLYRKRWALMQALMVKDFPPVLLNKFTRPRGGMFTWIELPQGKDTRRLFDASLEAGVVFLPGNSFYPVDPVYNTMRLCFACTPEDQIAEGMRRLGKTLRAFLKAK